jgi:hypothetical protein
MSDGLGALVIMGVGIGGYAIYRHWKRGKDREERYLTGFDPRFAFSIPQGTHYWLTTPHGVPDGALDVEWGIYADGVLGFHGKFVRVNVDGVPLWIKKRRLLVNPEFGPEPGLPGPSALPQATSGNFEYPGEDVTGLYSWSHAHR